MINLILFRQNNHVQAIRWSEFIRQPRFANIFHSAQLAYEKAHEAGYICPEVEIYRQGLTLKWKDLSIWIEPHYGAAYLDRNMKSVSLIDFDTEIENATVENL
jgi:hypothetical protein